MKKQLFLAFCLGLALQMKAQPVSFRGDNHCGKYPDEKGLLKQWPAEGPEKLWVVTDGSGAFFAHPSIFNGVLYLRHGEALIAYKVK